MEQTRTEYRYFAFISYSHKDMAWAKWLQGKLENYRLPAQIRKKHVDLPQKIAPVFRDETDLAGPVLEEALQRELESSQYLIVICSPNSAASGYVNDEVRHFLALGRKKQIIPFVVDGTPFSADPATECFPQAVRDIRPELLGISVREHGKKDAFSRLVATLLRLPADEVVMREKKRELFRSVLAASVSAVLALVLGLVWWYNTEHVAYYNAYTYRMEVPEGLCELTPAQRASTGECYRFTTLRGRVIRVETVNSLGVVVESVTNSSTTEYPVMEFEYSGAGVLTTVIQCDTAGNEVSRKSLEYTADGRIIVEFDSSVTGEAVGLSADMSTTLTGSNSSDKSMINRQDNTYDGEGRMIRSMYYWYSTFHPACDNNGVYGKSYTYNARDQIETITNLDRDGNPINCRYGWATIVMEYDAMGNLAAEAYYSVDGTKAITEEGFHGRKLTYDSSGNLVEVAHVNKEGQLCNTDDGYSRQVAEYDSRGFMTGFRTFNAQGAAVANEHGTHEYRYEYDEDGRPFRAWLLDADGNPVEDPDLGYASLVRTYDADGNDQGQWLYDAQGQVLCVRKLAYRDGKKVSTTHEDGDGNPICYNGYHTSRLEYDRYGNCSREAYYDTDGGLILTELGYAARESDYDEFGNVVELRYYGADDALCLCVGGHAVAKFTYVDGRRTGAEYFGVSGEPVLTKGGYHRCRMTYDEIGFCTRIENYGTDGSLIVIDEGYAVAEQERDAAGNVTQIRYYGTRNEPILLNGEYHMARYRFDAANNMTHSWYYDTEGNLTMRKDGYAAMERDFDEYGDTIAWRYYGVENEPILMGGEYHETRYRRDAHRNITELWYYGTDGQLILIGDGYAGMKADYNEQGNMVGVWYYGADGQPMLKDGAYHGIRWQEDENGNTTHQWFYGTDGSLIPQSSGAAAMERDYDEQGNLIAVRYYGAENEPVLMDGECHENRWYYDDRGNIIRMECYGTDGNLILISDGYAVQEIDVDSAGNITAIRYYGTENEPVLNGSFHEILWFYDEEGNETGVAGYDAEGNLIYENTYD